MNIQDPDYIRQCTSCQVCAAVCPKEAIKVVLDKDGFYRPIIENEKCIDCGLCRSVCYKYVDAFEDIDVDKLINYAASAKLDEVILNTTSGGIGDVLCEQLLEDGYLCVGVKYDLEKNIAVNTTASSRTESYAFRGSKYIQSYTLDAFKEVLTKHVNSKVAIFGTPCHIFAIDKYLRKIRKRDNFILIDLYCHGCPSILAWNKYIESIQTKTGEMQYDRVSFRTKVYGWGGYYVASMIKDGKTMFLSPKINDNFYTLFFSDMLLNDSCYDCRARSSIAASDIRIGDFWGKKYLFNHRGVSLVTINPSSERGALLFERIKTKISFIAHPSSDCISYQSWGKSYEVNKNMRRHLLDVLGNPKYTIEDAVRIYRSAQSLSHRCKRLIKNTIMLLPRPLMMFIKYIVS